LERAQRVLPPHVQPVLLADCGLASPMVVKLVQQRGWDYLLRVQHETTLRTAPRGPLVGQLAVVIVQLVHVSAQLRCHSVHPLLELDSECAQAGIGAVVVLRQLANGPRQAGPLDSARRACLRVSAL
jgi:hypothetical protein